MVDFFVENPLLLLFAVVAFGAAVGTVRIKGVSLGPAAALFAGLAVGAMDERLTTPAILAGLQSFGLVLFTYTIGLASGPQFFAGFRRGGVRIALVALGLIGFLALLCAGISEGFGFTTADRAGLFAGATTNTPSLQAAIDQLGKGRGNPVVAYSLAYPSAVIAMLIAVTVLLRGARSTGMKGEGPPGPALVNWTVRIERDDLPPLSELRAYAGNPLTFSRYEHDGRVDVATNDVRLAQGDLVVVVGPEDAVRGFTDDVGQRSDRHLPLDRRAVDMRRMVVSNRALAGKHLGDLDLAGRFGATVTRVRRGDADLIAADDLPLQLGDRIRVVATVDRLPAVARFVGDSDRSLAELDAFGFAIGIAAGLALGAITIPLPFGLSVELGPGGGPLVIGLILGFVSRLGPVTFQAPQAANLTLRQLGVYMFLACAGLRSGATFWAAVQTRTGVQIAFAGAVIAGVFAAAVALAARYLVGHKGAQGAGTLAGIETQPAALAYAQERTRGDERVATAYALAFPVAMILKIVIIQLLI